MDDPADDVLQFIAERIDTVPQIETLLLLWEARPATLTAAVLATRIFVTEDAAARVLRELEQRNLAVRTAEPIQYAYNPGWEPNPEFMARVDRTYRRHLIRIANLIHSKASPAVLDFARAFEPKKES